MIKMIFALTFFCILASGCESPENPAKAIESSETPILPTHDAAYKLEDLVTSDAINTACESFVSEAQNKKHLFEQSTVIPTHNNFYEPIDSMMVSLNNLSGRLRIIYDAFNDPTLRDIARECELQLSKFESEIWLSQDIYSKFSTLAASNVNSETDYSVQKIMRKFKRSGVDRDEATRQKIYQLNNELSKIGQEFNKNINESVLFVTVKPEELVGLPKEYIDARQSNEHGEIKISTRYPDLIPILSYAENDDVRKRLWFAFWQRAYPQNVDVMQALLQKRFEYAQLLGFDNYAQYILDDKMAKTPERVSAFLSELNGYTIDADLIDYNRLLNRYKKVDPSAEKLELWQRDFAYELVLNEQLNIDSKAIGEYFNYDKTKAGILALIQTLFDIKITVWDTWVWDESVSAYEIFDNGKLIGQFYLDSHPRDGKFNHAKIITLQKGITDQQLPVATMLANFPRGSEPLSHNDVVTFLHEFGHVMHVMFASSKWNNTAGISTERDFLEAPSQMLENWLWHYPTLSRFATNKNGEVLPEHMFESMKAARHFNLGMNTRQQLHYSAFSLAVYNQDPTDLDVDKLSDELQSIYTRFPPNKDQYLYTSFTHLNGYSAAYYSYQWSLAISTDILSRFEATSMMDVKTATDYRELILEKGGTKPADELVADFLGRPVSFEAYAEKLRAYDKRMFNE